MVQDWENLLCLIKEMKKKKHAEEPDLRKGEMSEEACVKVSTRPQGSWGLSVFFLSGVSHQGGKKRGQIQSDAEKVELCALDPDQETSLSKVGWETGKTIQSTCEADDLGAMQMDCRCFDHGDDFVVLAGGKNTR